jgi:hypothetical protein
VSVPAPTGTLRDAEVGQRQDVGFDAQGARRRGEVADRAAHGERAGADLHPRRGQRRRVALETDGRREVGDAGRRLGRTHADVVQRKRAVERRRMLGIDRADGVHVRLERAGERVVAQCGHEHREPLERRASGVDLEVDVRRLRRRDTALRRRLERVATDRRRLDVDPLAGARAARRDVQRDTRGLVDERTVDDARAGRVDVRLDRERLARAARHEPHGERSLDRKGGGKRVVQLGQRAPQGRELDRAHLGGDVDGHRVGRRRISDRPDVTFEAEVRRRGVEQRRGDGEVDRLLQPDVPRLERERVQDELARLGIAPVDDVHGAVLDLDVADDEERGG